MFGLLGEWTSRLSRPLDLRRAKASLHIELCKILVIPERRGAMAGISYAGLKEKAKVTLYRAFQRNV